MNTYSKIVQCLREAANRMGGGKSRLLRLVGAEKRRSTFYRAIDEQHPVLPGPDILCEWLDKIDVQISMPWLDYEKTSSPVKMCRARHLDEPAETRGEEGVCAYRDVDLEDRGIEARKAVVMIVEGRGMPPTIVHGDLLLLDLARKDPEDGGIYVVGLGGQHLIRRLQRVQGAWLLGSDDPRAMPVTAEDGSPDKLVIYGRVCAVTHFFDS